MNKKSFGLCLTASILAVFVPNLVDALESSSQINDFQTNYSFQTPVNRHINNSEFNINLLSQSTSKLMLKNASNPQTKARVINSDSSTMTGTASWYGPGFEGRVCANGEVFDPNALTAAHKTLPFNTRVLVTNLNNGRSVIVRINDRGPYVNDRIIDLSAQAAREIGMFNHGVMEVSLDIL